MSDKSETTKIVALKEALEACMVALGHVGIREAFNRGGMTDSAAAKYLLLIETSEPGGINGVCSRAFEKAQTILRGLEKWPPPAI